MNAIRRKQIAAAIAQVSALSLIAQDLLGKLADARDAVEQIRDEEQESFDNMPECLQEADRGQQAQAGLDQLDEAFSDLEALHDSIETTDLDDVITKLEEAKDGAA